VVLQTFSSVPAVSAVSIIGSMNNQHVRKWFEARAAIGQVLIVLTVEAAGTGETPVKF
jgi:hypothetical protein